MITAAKIEHNGVPIDTNALSEIKKYWTTIQEGLIKEVDTEFGFFEGRTFKVERFSAYVERENIPWPSLPSGKLALDEDTFRQMSNSFPRIAPIRDLRLILSKMRLSDLAVGDDSRNRCLLSTFSARTGRNQPSNSKFIFGPSVWLRNLIKPEPGFGLAYIDWSQQEFGIAAALSGDSNMCEAYLSGDPYLSFAKQAGAIPSEGNKSTHGIIREQFKQAALAVQYGMGHESLATRINSSVFEARELLNTHRKTFKGFWKWSDGVIDFANLHLRLHTVFGWRLHVEGSVNNRSLRNFPMQANGAEMLRLACIMASEEGVKICAPVHDAILIEAPIEELESAVVLTQKCMAQASGIILDGFELKSDATLINYPNRYKDPRGKSMWARINSILNKFKLTNDNEKNTLLPAHK